MPDGDRFPHQRRRRHAQHSHQHGDAPAEFHLLHIAQAGPPAHEEVAHHQRGAGVVAGAHGRHQDGDQPGQHHAAQPDGQQVTHHARIGHVGPGQVRIERVGDDAGQHQNERDQQLQEAGEDGALLALVHRTRTQHALNVGLVHAPIEHAAEQVPDEEAGDGQFVVERLGHVQQRRVHARHQPAPAAHADQAHDGQHNAADDQPGALHHVGIDHRAQAALHRIERRQNGERDHHRQLVPAEQQVEQQRAGPQVNGILGEHVHQQQVAGEERAQAPAETVLQEFGDGVDLLAQIQRREQRGENDQAPRRHPFITAGDQAHAVTVAGQAHNMFGRNVRSQQRHADERPAQVAPGQEVFGVGLFLARRAQHGAHHQHQAEDNDNGIEDANHEQGTSL